MKKLSLFALLSIFSIVFYNCTDDTPIAAPITAANFDKLVGSWKLEAATSCSQPITLITQNNDTTLFIEQVFFQDRSFTQTSTQQESRITIGCSTARYSLQQDALVLDPSSCILDRRRTGIAKYYPARFIDDNTLELTERVDIDYYQYDSGNDLINDAFEDTFQALLDLYKSRCPDEAKQVNVYTFKKQYP